jgi:putative ABC transport system permease protein
MEGMGSPDTLTVVGVMADARMVSLDRPAEPYIAVPLSQHYMPGVSLVVRRATDASSIPTVRALVRDMNPNLPVSEALTLADVTAIGLVPQRLAAAVSGSLGIVALLLATIGVYGVTAYSVSRRVREIGIRVALGADARQVLRLMLRQGLVLAAVGVVTGSALAATGAKLLESLLYGISAFDAPAFGGALALFAVASFVATWLPARRALAVDPVVALRQE